MCAVSGDNGRHGETRHCQSRWGPRERKPGKTHARGLTLRHCQFVIAERLSVPVMYYITSLSICHCWEVVCAGDVLHYVIVIWIDALALLMVLNLRSNCVRCHRSDVDAFCQGLKYNFQGGGTVQLSRPPIHSWAPGSFPEPMFQ